MTLQTRPVDGVPPAPTCQRRRIRESQPSGSQCCIRRTSLNSAVAALTPAFAVPVAKLVIASAASASTNSCRWPCSMLSAPDQCAKCNAPVHRLCQSQGETANGWSHHGESALCFPTCHPDAPRVAAVPVSAAAVVPPSILELVPAVVPKLATAESEATEIPATAAADAVAVPCGSHNLGLG